MRTVEFENNYFTEMVSGSEAGSHSRLINFVFHSTLVLRVIKKKKKWTVARSCFDGLSASEQRGNNLKWFKCFDQKA